MILLVDIGNTSVSFGLLKNNKIVSTWRVATPKVAEGLARAALKRIEGIIISSVVPRALAVLKEALKKKTRSKVWVLGENIICPIKNLYNKPDEVGQDRLVNALAGYNLIKGPCIVVDFGTAVTFDVVSGKGEYLGGIIFPGMGIALEALCKRAALLPKRLKLGKIKILMGKDTRSSMLSGIINGYAAMADGLVIKLKKELGGSVKVLATGGYAGFVAGRCKAIDMLKPNLTLDGLALIYDKNIRKTAKSS